MGLPHPHILMWLYNKINPNEIDAVISAQIPDPKVDKDLNDTVIKSMIHGPCGAFNQTSPCIVDRKYTKRYPRALVCETITGHDGYPLYRRRSIEDGGMSVVLKKRGTDVHVDNRWVVSDSPLLSKTFNAHINVEYCNSIKSIK